MHLGATLCYGLGLSFGTTACSPTSSSASAPTVQVEPPPGPSPSAIAAQPPFEDPIALEPPVPVGDGVVVRPVRPGHYAASTYFYQYSSCSRSSSSYSAQTSLVLDLDENGTASGCRGKHSRHNGGPRGGSHFAYQTREQQGLSGAWRPHDAWIQVDLALSDEPCPQQRAYTNKDPKPWKLRCLAIEPKGHRVLPRPTLACQFAEPTYTEGLGYAVPDVLPGEWLLLGAGKGLVAEWRDEPMTSRRVSVVPATQRITVDAGAKPFPR